MWGYLYGCFENSDTPKSSILVGFSIINHPFWGKHPYFWFNTHISSEPANRFINLDASRLLPTKTSQFEGSSFKFWMTFSSRNFGKDEPNLIDGCIFFKGVESIN